MLDISDRIRRVELVLRGGHGFRTIAPAILARPRSARTTTAARSFENIIQLIARRLRSLLPFCRRLNGVERLVGLPSRGCGATDKVAILNDMHSGHRFSRCEVDGLQPGVIR